MLLSKRADPQNQEKLDKKRGVITFLLFILVAVAFAWIFHVKPPFMSPDEGAHLSRADALRSGNILLFSPDGKMNSGGYIDKNLDKFRASYDPFIRLHDAEKANQTKRDMQNLHWSGQSKFYSMANTAFYFPAIYIPQALGFEVGHLLNLSVFSTYKLVSSLTLFVSFILLLTAWKIHPIPAPALAILLLPMSVFQFFSPTIDGLTFALTTLTLSLLINLLNSPYDKVFIRRFIMLAVCVFILSSSRANLLPLIFLPLWLYIKTRKKSCLITFAITAVLVLSWTYLSIKTVNDNGIHHPGIEQMDVLKHYILHPFEVLSIIINTVTDYSIFNFYYQSFIGKLGWLDISLPDFAYWGFGLFIYTIFIINFRKANFTDRKAEFLLLLLFFIGITMLTFCALLVQWSAFPTEKVDGVQGRYFIIPFIILSYALQEKPEYRKASYFMLAIMAVISVYFVHSALEARYF